MVPRTFVQARRGAWAQGLCSPQILLRGTFHPDASTTLGQVGLYVAAHPNDTAVEKFDNPGKENQLWIAEIEFERSMKVVDLTVGVLGTQSRLPLLVEGLRYFVTAPALADKAPSVHHVPRYIADLARLRNLDGILYTSSRRFPFREEYEYLGRNLVILSFQHARVANGPKLHKWRRAPKATLEPPRMIFDPPIPTEWWQRLRRDAQP